MKVASFSEDRKTLTVRAKNGFFSILKCTSAVPDEYFVGCIILANDTGFILGESWMFDDVDANESTVEVDPTAEVHLEPGDGGETETRDPRNQKSGNLAVVVTVSYERRRIDVVFADGKSGYTTTEGLDFDLQPGDVIMLDEHGGISKEDEIPWPESIKVGVVRGVYQDKVLVDDGFNFHLIPSRESNPANVGHTVAFSSAVGIRSELEEFPVFPRNSVDEFDIERYCWKVDPDQRLRFEDFGGYPEVVARARELIEVPLLHADKLDSINARPIRGVLFTGPPGTGKTYLARIIADRSDAAFYSISGPEIVSKWVGDSEGNLRKIFDDAASKDRAIIFFDEIDSIAEERTDSSHESSKRVVAQLLTLIDGFREHRSKILVIAATNRPDEIDQALRRPGRFDWSIEFGIPTESDRRDILRVSMERVSFVDPGAIPVAELARRTDGWSAAKLTSIWTEAAIIAANDQRGALHVEDVVAAYERMSCR
ncbi:ATP-dependent zinc metalloprotease FtsH 3 (plasmid) [Tsukamurella tyrosinosolvens]|uniref:ATPase family associated with various cellular activities (AAA) n=2 Tax=Tsukamurella tyrosinosolvens TaxID=57704 RepID=A0A1H4WHZ8_TSUTY|nr:ATPase family associated with various cellular activities (AAA) [Tsukamurella tyrosinosolvens]VEH89360.1 ATP-dependent zinc metalloprotease FtsH 3 [Tsukamurella tyrosinosolvens]